MLQLELLIVARSLSSRVAALALTAVSTDERAGHIVYGFPDGRHLAQAQQAAGLRVRRFLDRYHVAFDPRAPETEAAAERVLFDLIADVYDNAVDVQRNKENIGVLCETVAQSVEATKPRVLDWGCGTGLITEVAPKGFILRGLDASPSMRRNAKARGLVTITGRELGRLRPASFDAVVASYALHLAQPEPDLDALHRALRIGGVVAANFHKNSGLGAVQAHLAQCGRYEVTAFEGPVAHGLYRMFRRLT